MKDHKIYALFFNSMKIRALSNIKRNMGERKKESIWLAHFGINSLAEKGDCLENIYYIVILNA